MVGFSAQLHTQRHAQRHRQRDSECLAVGLAVVVDCSSFHRIEIDRHTETTSKKQW